MRLAADYQQQKNRKTEKEINANNRQVVKLGRGLPQEGKRKRGISRSEENSRIERMSLGRREVSREKLAQLQKQQASVHIMKPAYLGPEEKIVTTATYGNRRPENYAVQHLLVSTPRQSHRAEQNQSERYLKTVKSQGFFFQQSQESFYQNPSKISAENIKKEVFIPQPVMPPAQQSRNYSLDKQNLVRPHQMFIQQPSNLQNYQRHQIVHSPQINFTNKALQYSQQKFIPLQSYKSGNPQPSKKIVFIHQPANSAPFNNPIYTQKMIASREDPYNLYNSKMTRRHGDPSPDRIREEQLKQTKKQMRGIPQSKQLSSSLLKNSLQNSKNRSSKKLTSLWDANKAESRVSMKESQQIAIQQSSVMIDYFNPSESMLKKYDK